MNQRSMSVAGSFYPLDPESIVGMINQFNETLQQHPEILKRYNELSGKAIIVPHAGWVYSGYTANIAHQIVCRTHPKTIIVIGPSHRVGFEGVSVADEDVYMTPLGSLEIDREWVKKLRENFGVRYVPTAHQEHSTEVQMPFIKYYSPETKVIELVYGYADPKELEPIISEALRTQETAVVISTDLSHFYRLSDAKRLDSICLEAIRNENVHTLHEGCEACGMIGVEAMLAVAKKEDYKSILLDYRTSADAFGDTSRVVGYTSALFG